MYALKDKNGTGYLKRILIEPGRDDSTWVVVHLKFSSSDFLLFSDRVSAQAFSRCFSQPDCVLCAVEV